MAKETAAEKIAKLNKKFDTSEKDMRVAKLNKKFGSSKKDIARAKLARKFDTSEKDMRVAKLNKKFGTPEKERVAARREKLRRKFGTPQEEMRGAKDTRLKKKFSTSPKKSVLSRIKESLGIGRPKTYDGTESKPSKKPKGSGARRNFAAGVGESNRQKSMRMKAGGSVKKCKRDGIAQRGRTKGRVV